MAAAISETVQRFTAETLKAASKQSKGCYVDPLRLRRAIKKYIRGCMIQLTGYFSVNRVWKSLSKDNISTLRLHGLNEIRPGTIQEIIQSFWH